MRLAISFSACFGMLIHLSELDATRVGLQHVSPATFLANFSVYYKANRPALVQFEHWSEVFAEPWNLTAFAAMNKHLEVGVQQGSYEHVRRRGKALRFARLWSFVTDPKFSEVRRNGESSFIFDYNQLRKSTLRNSLKYMDKLVPSLTRTMSNSSLVLSIAHKSTGVMFHAHTEAYFFLGEGRKRWFLLPPHSSRVPGIPNVRRPEDVRMSIAAFVAQYGSASGSAWRDFPELIDLEQAPNSMLFIPNGWYHATWTEVSSFGASVHPEEGFCYSFETAAQCHYRWDDPDDLFGVDDEPGSKYLPDGTVQWTNLAGSDDDEDDEEDDEDHAEEDEGEETDEYEHQQEDEREL